MYQIIIDNRDGERYILHDSRSNRIRVTNANCDIELNKTGTLSFKINPTHPNFDKIFKHKSEIYLYQDEECIFCGRVLNDEVDIFNFKTIVCEGMLSYLLDSIQRAKAYSITSNNKINEYLTDILNIHNSQVDDHKQFSVGQITEVDSHGVFISSDEDTLTTINNYLVEKYNNTYLIADFKNGKKVINYVTNEQLPYNSQSIIFGKNLLKLTRSIKGEEIATAIIPLGVTTNSEELEDGTKVDYKLDIKELPDGLIKDSIYKKGERIVDEESVKKYGLITKVINYSEVEDAQELIEYAVDELNYYNKLASTLELNAFDLHLLDVSIESFRVGQKVKVYSKIHGLDDYLIVQRISIDIDNPDKTTILLADEKRIEVSPSISKKNNDSNKDINTLNKDLDNNKWDYTNKDYFGSDGFKTNMSDYFNGQNGTGSYTDLSQYALKYEVQIAFDMMANLLEEV